MSIGEYLQLISIDPWHIAASVLNLIILFFIVKRFLYKPVVKILNERNQQVRDIYSDAEKARADAEHDKAEYSAALASAHEKSAEIVRAASEEARKSGEEIIAGAKTEADRLRRKADEDIANERRKAVSELKGEIGSLSVELAGKVIDREINPEDHKRLVDDFIDGLGDGNDDESR
ncbi:MAG: F0F1 ATP synthase subunit B [Clostridiales bacterium]|nr:F0F1 ATP synthase subunit B [Clostridiales bacterium]